MSNSSRLLNPEYVPLGSMDPSSDLYSRKQSSGEENRDFKQRRISSSSFRRTVVSLWLIEWSSWIFACATIASIVAVLVVFNGRSIPDWPYGITLGALVSLLATLATVALGVPISSGIGQAQWIWFMRERTLRDFGFIDEASRSVFGSARLLFHRKGGFFALTGALLAITILGVNPFAQQVVKYSEKVINSTAASIGVASEYNTFIPGAGGTDVDLSMKAAIQSALLDVNANNKTFSVQPQCSTGNCTWEGYTSLSVCGRCADLSSEINVTQSDGGATSAALPNGISIDYIPSLTSEGLIAMKVNTTLNSTDNPVASIKFTEWKSPLLDVITLIPTYDYVGPYASECIIQFCVRNYSSKSVNGTFTETTIGEPQYIESDDGLTSVNVSGKTYSVDMETLNGLYDYVQNMFNSEVQQRDSLSPQEQWPNDVSQSIFHWTNQSSDHLPTGLFENLAASMSLNMRSRGNGSYAGVASATETVVSVDWYWMIFPFVMLALVLCYLIGIIWISASRNLHPWKNSNLVALMHGLIDDNSRNLVRGVDRLEEMEALADMLKGKLIYDGMEGEEGKHLGMSIRNSQ